jgi:hypothetical protein
MEGDLAGSARAAARSHGWRAATLLVEERRLAWSPAVLEVYQGRLRFEAEIEVEIAARPGEAYRRAWLVIPLW